MSEDFPRLIEHAFPLKQASLDSVHEKNVRHGHISTLHIWPARRPLAACRAALIATLLPDPSAEPKPEGMTDEQWQKECAKRRQELCEKIGGKVVKKIERKRMPNGSIVEREKEETEGGILHWGRETENAATLDWFREEIRKAYGGRAPKVLDPFAGGGAIPLEAMRLGCEATAVDINPVAWFILKCTLEYPQKLAGQKRPLPDFILRNQEFMERYFKAQGLTGAGIKREMKKLGHAIEERQQELGLALEDGGISIDADLAWHVRAWGQWVMNQARRDLAEYYPTYADFEPLAKEYAHPYEPQPMRLVPLREDDTPDIDSLNREFSEEYLKDKQNPRWVAKPAVAYLWARTVQCKNCRATVPLLKTRWLCKKANRRVLLTMEPNEERTGVVFGVQTEVPVRGGNAAQRRETDKVLGAGTMSRAGAACPGCGTIMMSEDLRLEGQAGRMGATATGVVIDGPNGKEFRIPTQHEIDCAGRAEAQLTRVFADIPFGLPAEPISAGGSRSGGGSPFTVHLYGLDQWGKLLTPRQGYCLGVILRASRAARDAMVPFYREEGGWAEAICCGLAVGVDRIADRQSTVCRWDNTRINLQGTFTRFALPITWDFCEGNPISETTGNYLSNLSWLCEFWEHAMAALSPSPSASVIQQSATTVSQTGFDCVVTDPPYYDAIPYSDLMDFFYVWLRRTLSAAGPELDEAFASPLSPKWDHARDDGELIDDPSRHGGDAAKSKAAYEEGMAKVFVTCQRALLPEGRLVVVFAHKHPDAWETLVSAIIRAGFIVDGSWPIQTEMTNRTRGLSSAALASSLWIVCRKRPLTARPGWDNRVSEEMRTRIGGRLREFWDAGIRGPDFVWAATGPALEAYSKYPAVRRAAPKEGQGPVMEVHEFLVEVRRMVVDFVVGRVLSGDGAGEELAVADHLDEVTAYYLLHRHDFGMDEAPVGTCILYAVSCGLSDSDLASTWDILASGKASAAAVSTEDDDEDSEADGDDEAAGEPESSGGSNVKLKTWKQRDRKSMGYEAPGGRPVPLIDRIHRIMHLWREGDVTKVDEYLDGNALRRSELFKRLLQSLIELSDAGSDERPLLESLSNHVQAKGARDDRQQRLQL